MLVESLSSPVPASAGRTDRDPLDAGAVTARGALSANTERAVRSDLAIYTVWCADRGVPALPASAATIATFVDAMARVRAPSTVRRYVASIAAAHRAIGRAKTARSEPVRRALQRMHRRTGRRQAQAKGLTGALRERLLDAPGERLIDVRNRALLAVAYDTLLRRSELVSLEVSDLLEEIDGTATVLVRRSKADPEGRGATVYLARDSVALVRAWMQRSGVGDGRLFRSLCRGVVGAGLDASQVPRIFKAMAERAGVSGAVVQHISGHSPRCRRGARHGRGRHRHGGHPARRAVEDHDHGQPLRGAAAGPAQRRRAARAAAAARIDARWCIMRRSHLGPAVVSPPSRAQRGRIFRKSYRESIAPMGVRSALSARMRRARRAVRPERDKRQWNQQVALSRRTA